MSTAESTKRLLAYHEAQAQWCRRRAREAEAERKTLTFRRMLSRGHQHEKWAEVIKQLARGEGGPPPKTKQNNNISRNPSAI